MLERTDVWYEHDRASLRILRIQSDHLAPNALTLPAIFSVSCQWDPVQLSHSCTRLDLAWEPALSLNFVWMLPAFAEIIKADFSVPAISGCTWENQPLSVHTSKAAKRSLLQIFRVVKADSTIQSSVGPGSVKEITGWSPVGVSRIYFQTIKMQTVSSCVLTGYFLKITHVVSLVWLWN